MTQGFDPRFGPVTPEESAALDADSGETIAREETIDNELSLKQELEAREQSRLAAARRFQFEKELELFIRQAGGSRNIPLKWARNRMID